MPQYTLNEDEVAELDVEVAGTGGFQDLMRRLQGGFNAETREIDVSDADDERIRRYCTDYGPGGWQARIARAFRRVMGFGEQDD